MGGPLYLCVIGKSEQTKSKVVYHHNIYQDIHQNI